MEKGLYNDIEYNHQKQNLVFTLTSSEHTGDIFKLTLPLRILIYSRNITSLTHPNQWSTIVKIVPQTLDGNSWNNDGNLYTTPACKKKRKIKISISA